jgi:hypothetical protein
MRLVARLLQEIGDPAEAKAAWQRVLTAVPDDPEATAALAALDAES